MWNVFSLAKAMHVRPSELLDISDAYEAYCIDDAVMTFGQHIANKLSEVTGKNAKQIEGQRSLLLRRLLSPETKQLFRSPVATK
jgi:hypothetical protein